VGLSEHGQAAKMYAGALPPKTQLIMKKRCTHAISPKKGMVAKFADKQHK
jgi:hypothetical protein